MAGPSRGRSLIKPVSSQYLDAISLKAVSLEQKLYKKSEITLARMKKQEMKLKKKLSRLDSTRVKEIIGNAEQKYAALEQRLQGRLPGSYTPSLDTTITSLKFLQQNPKLIWNEASGSARTKR